MHSVLRTPHGSRVQNSYTISQRREERLHSHRCWLQLEGEMIPADCISKAFQLRWALPASDKESFKTPGTFNIICLPPEVTALLPPLGSSEGAGPCRQLQSSDRGWAQLIASEVSSYSGRKRNLMPDYVKSCRSNSIWIVSQCLLL